MTTTYERLSNLNLDTVDRAVDDWRRTKDDLGTLAEQARSGMRGKAESADWEGVNAGVTRQFITTTASSFDYAHEQAHGIHRVLGDLVDALRAQRVRLQEVKAEAEGQGLIVTADGRVLVVGEDPTGMGNSEPRVAEEIAQVQAAKQQLIEEYEVAISRILGEVAEIDASTDRALREIAGQEDSSFRATDYDTASADEVQGLADAERAQELMGQDPAQLSDEELSELDDLLATQEDNPHFSVALATGLGAEGTLHFWTDLIAHPYPPDDTERTALLDSLGNGLGAALGTATRSDDPAMATWEQQMIELGPQQMPMGYNSGPYGYQVMSDLMSHGKYGEDFLVAYGDALITFERDMDPPGLAWNASSLDHVPPEVFTRDPMTGYMEALSARPDAASDIFVQHDRMEYLLTRPIDQLPVEAGENGGYASRHAIGNALFAATTGMDPNDLGTVPPEHTRHNEIILTNAVNVLAATNSFPVEFREPLAGILINHGDNVIDSVNSMPSDRLIDPRELFDVVTQVSADDAAYGLLNEGMHYALVDSLTSMPDNPDQPLVEAGRTVGFLEQARNEALAGAAREEIQRTSLRTDWTTYLLGGAVDFVPHAHGMLSGAVDLAAQGWLRGEVAGIEGQLAEELSGSGEVMDQRLSALANHWFSENEDWARHSEGYTRVEEAYGRLSDAAGHGQDGAEGDPANQ